MPFFSSVELSGLERACRGNTFAQRRDAAVLSVFRATGIRLAELAVIRYAPDDPGRSDLDLERREIRVHGKGGKDRTVRIDHEAARRVDRYLRARARHAQAYRLGLWLGTGGRRPGPGPGPLTANTVHPDALRLPWAGRRTVFVNSMSDLFVRVPLGFVRGCSERGSACSRRGCAVEPDFRYAGTLPPGPVLVGCYVDDAGGGR